MDKPTGLPVSYCVVIVLKKNVTLQAAQTDTAGNYRVSPLEPGLYTVVFRVTGYENDTLRGVVVSAGKITYLDARLEPENPCPCEPEVIKEKKNVRKKKKKKAANDSAGSSRWSMAGYRRSPF